jgi:diguanylate cyclase (GGDEF)-like protein
MEPAFDILEAARTKDEDIQAIVMTGSATLENAVDSLRAGVSDYLIKPFDPFTIFDLAVLRALDRRRLVKENRRLFLENQQLAARDPLTGLLNRFQMRKVLHQEIRRTGRYCRSLAVLMIDMDSFKEINDTFGHIKGDEVLVHVAKVIDQSIRTVDTAVRFGGDEFLVIMPEADMHIAGDVARRIGMQVRCPLKDIGSISVSVGAAVWDSSMGSIEVFLKAADDAMYREKANKHRKSSAEIQSRVSVPAAL